MKIAANTIVLPRPTDDLIMENEKVWRQSLPSDYKQFIKKFNGAVLTNSTLEVNGHQYIVSRFLCMLSEPSESNDGQYDIDVIETRIGEYLTANPDLIGVELLPIALVQGDNYLCLDYRQSESEPTVCLWLNVESDEFEPATIKVADSFSELINKIHSGSKVAKLWQKFFGR